MVLLLTAIPERAASADGPPSLSNNPFARPPSEAIPVQREIRNGGDDTPAALPLLATMVSRVNRLANVGGRILKPGDDYQGYRLVLVHEQFAVFERDGNSTTVYVKPLLAEDDD
jgi:hypothetical protein